MTRRTAVLALVGCAAVWGVSFSIIKQALEWMSPVVLLAIRFLLAGLLVAPALRGLTRRELPGALLLALLFWAGFMFQTIGLEWTTPSRSGFMTGLVSPLTPLVFFLVYRAVPGATTLLAIALAAAGTYFLTGPESGGLNRGDVLTLFCAMLFAGQIVAAGHYARRIPAQRLLAVQLGVTGLLSLLSSPLIEAPRLTLPIEAVLAIAFLSISAVATFYLQLRAQQVVSPSHTALIFTLEPVAAAITSYLVFGEQLSPTQWLGAALILAAMVLPEEAGRRAGGLAGGEARNLEGHCEERSDEAIG